MSGCAMFQLYTNDMDFTKFYPMQQKGQAADKKKNILSV
jgi:hypothetical protein